MESKKISHIPLIPVSTTRRPELELLDPVSPTSLKAAKPPSEGSHVRVELSIVDTNNSNETINNTR